MAVVSIAGLWRTGKSYLLNQLSGATCDNDKTGFQVGASVNACTKGLWLWGEPVRLPDGLTVLFIDTEGLGSTSRTQTEDSQIFSLALLLSSLFVWNSRGVIDGNAMEDFALVVNLTKHIHVRSEAARKRGARRERCRKASSIRARLERGRVGGRGVRHHERRAQHFPVLIRRPCLRRGARPPPPRETNAARRWRRGAAATRAPARAREAAAARAMTHTGLPLGRPRLHAQARGQRAKDQRPAVPRERLKPQRSFTSEAASRNQIRTLLGSFFRERDCVTLVRPAEDEATLKKLSQVPVSSLRPEFQRGLANLKDKVYAQTRAKSVNGRALSGAMLATLAKTYADALNAGGVPTIIAWDRGPPIPSGGSGQ